MNSATVRHIVIAALFALVLVSANSIASCAGELDGAWANDSAMCDRMLAKKNGKARLVKSITRPLRCDDPLTGAPL